MLGGDPFVSQMPRLEAFDEEFGREPMANLQEQQRRKLRFSNLIIGAVLGAIIGLALARPALLPISRNAGSETSAEQINRLVREVASLKKEIAWLTHDRQQAADRIASLEAAQQEPRGQPASMYWYSDMAALIYEPPFRGVQTEGRQR